MNWRAFLPQFELGQWFAVALVGVGEVLLVSRADSLTFVVSEVAVWLIVIAVAVVLAHPIVVGRKETDRRQIVVLCALIGFIHALAQVMVIGPHTWSLLALVSEPAIAGVVGFAIAILAKVIQKKNL